jgi:hypothetical protein
VKNNSRRAESETVSAPIGLASQGHTLAEVPFVDKIDLDHASPNSVTFRKQREIARNCVQRVTVRVL